MDDISEDCEMEEPESTEDRDRLSELPDSLILDILSLLEMRDVVSTTLLSRRWKNLWITIPCLNLTSYLANNWVRNFVYQALVFWKGTKLLKFIIENGFGMSLACDIDMWVNFAVVNNVEELNVHLTSYPESVNWDNVVASCKKDVYTAPQCLNSCSSITTLSLVGCNLRIHGSPNWNQLKSLSIDGVRFSERLINRVLSGAPQLEVFKLCLVESYENLNIRSTSLKKLKIEKYLYYEYEQSSTDTVLRIWAPNLVTFEISGLLYCKCLLTNISSLTDAILGFDGSQHYDDGGLFRNEPLGEVLSQIFQAIQHVERVELSDWCIEVLGAMEKKYLNSPLSNVKFLKLNVCIIELDEMVNLLGIFPKLKMLVVDHSGFREGFDCQYFYNDYYLKMLVVGPKSFLLELRTVKITSPLQETSPVFPYIEFLLKHASMLQKMVIRPRDDMSHESLFGAAEKLLSMPRSSPIAKVILRKK